MAVGMSAAEGLALQRRRLMSEFGRLGREGIQAKNSAGEDVSVGSVLGNDNAPKNEGPRPSA